MSIKSLHERLMDYFKVFIEILKNGKMIIAVWVMFFGTGIYTVYDFLGIEKPKASIVVKEEKIPSFPILVEPKIPTVSKGVKSLPSREVVFKPHTHDFTPQIKKVCKGIVEDHVDKAH